jgi:hypothetical protein
MLPNFKWPEPKEQVDHKIIRDIIEHKCHIIGIPQDEQGPAYAFSVGLYLHFNHPEIVIFGLDYNVAGDVINQICSLVKKGRRFKHEETTHELFVGINAKLIDVAPKFYKEFFGTALWFYRSIGNEFQFMQVVWPDKNGHFPWDLNSDEKFRASKTRLKLFYCSNSNAKL